jgi:hypothetical protein
MTDALISLVGGTILGFAGGYVYAMIQTAQQRASTETLKADIEDIIKANIKKD